MTRLVIKSRHNFRCCYKSNSYSFFVGLWGKGVGGISPTISLYVSLLSYTSILRVINGGVHITLWMGQTGEYLLPKLWKSWRFSPIVIFLGFFILNNSIYLSTCLSSLYDLNICWILHGVCVCVYIIIVVFLMWKCKWEDR